MRGVAGRSIYEQTTAQITGKGIVASRVQEASNLSRISRQPKSRGHRWSVIPLQI